MTERVRIAVVGTGWWATEVHIPALLANADAELVALCDTNATRLNAAAEHFEIERRYTDIAVMLATEVLDGAVIATNHAAHYDVARQCLEQGLHLAIEKPFTVYAADARDLVELAKRQQREIVVGYPYNYLPFAPQVRALLAGGALGQVQYASAMFNSNVFDFLQGTDANLQTGVHGPGNAYADPVRSVGGHAHTQLTHTAGLLFFLTQLQPQRVQAMMQNFGLSVELAAVINVSFSNGAVGTVHGIGSLGETTHSDQDVHIYCSQGIVKLSTRLFTCTLYRPNQEPEDLHSPDGHGYPSHAPSQNLVGICRGTDDNRSPAEAGWHAVEVLHAAYESVAAAGQPIDVVDLY